VLILYRVNSFNLDVDSLENLILLQFDKLYPWFTPVCSAGKPMTGPVIIEEAKSL